MITSASHSLDSQTVLKIEFGAQWRTPLISALQKQRQADLCEFEARLAYRSESRTTNASYTEKPCLEKPKRRVTWMYMHKVRGQLEGVVFLLLPFGVWELNSSHQATQEASSTEPSQPPVYAPLIPSALRFCFFKILPLVGTVATKPFPCGFCSWWKLFEVSTIKLLPLHHSLNKGLSMAFC